MTKRSKDSRKTKLGYASFRFIVGVVIVGLIVLVIAYDINNGIEKRKAMPEMYQAWKSAFNNQTVSYDQWQLLYNNHMLPGQPEQKVKEDAENAAAIAIGISAGLSAGK